MTATPPRPVFPNYLQMRQPLPMRAWYVLRAGSIAISAALIVVLLVRPSLGLTIWWGFVIPFLPLWFFLAPGLWRNVCPMAALNQLPRLRGFSRGVTAPAWLRNYSYVIGFVLFMALAASRKAEFNTSGWATALLLFAALLAAFAGGLVFKGKSGWCSSICPLLPVQRVYGQTPFVVLPNAHCQPCVGCAKNCYDFNPHVAWLADMHDDDQYFAGYRRFFAGALPGFILGFYRVPNPPAISVPELYARLLLYVLASVGVFIVLSWLLKLDTAKLTVAFGAAALNIYYWFNTTNLAHQIQKSFGVTVPDSAVWASRAVVLALSALWLWRTFRKDNRYLAEVGGAPVATLAPAGVAAARRQSGSGQPEVTIMPEGRRIAAQAGRTLLDLVEAAGCQIEAGCRMGMCGADPVAIVEGMEQLSPVRQDEQSTLQRLGLATNTRLACVAKVQGSVVVKLKADPAVAADASRLRSFSFDRSVKNVVVIGNGIAGTTAADHVRRRHPECSITVIGREPHLLYNRMAIERLIYGRSAMQGLYLLPESWYQEHDVTSILNTRVTAISRLSKEIVLGTNERLPYDRLILAMGSRSTVPSIEGFGQPGTFVLREAGDAMAVRAYVQERGARRAVVAGGGLLGLEAAYALHRLGLRTTVLERSAGLLTRQLDPRGSGYLREYLEYMGLDILTNAETQAVVGNGHAHHVLLKDGRQLPSDIFLVAAGITPNVELAADAGLQVNRGVVVDDYMRTNDPAIFAAGDVAEHDGQVYGLWPTACDQAEVAALNAVGGEKPFTLTTPVTMLKVVGVDLLSIGRFTRTRPGDIAIAQIDDAEHGHRYRRLVISQGKIVGGILLGYPLDAPNVTAAVRQQVDVSSCLDSLKAGEWDVLASLV